MSGHLPERPVIDDDHRPADARLFVLIPIVPLCISISAPSPCPENHSGFRLGVAIATSNTCFFLLKIQGSRVVYTLTMMDNHERNQNKYGSNPEESEDNQELLKPRGRAEWAAEMERLLGVQQAFVNSMSPQELAADPDYQVLLGQMTVVGRELKAHTIAALILEAENITEE